MTPIIGALADAMVILKPAIEPIMDSFVAMADALAPLLPLAARFATVLGVPLAGALEGFFKAIGPTIDAISGPKGLGGGLAELMPLAEDLAKMFIDLGRDSGRSCPRRSSRSLRVRSSSPRSSPRSCGRTCRRSRTRSSGCCPSRTTSRRCSPTP